MQRYTCKLTYRNNYMEVSIEAPSAVNALLRVLEAGEMCLIPDDERVFEAERYLSTSEIARTGKGSIIEGVAVAD